MRLFGLLLAGCAAVAAQAPVAQAPAGPSSDDVVTFKSDVSLVRVDAQVLDRNGRALTGLTLEDFVIRDGGQVREIRNFAQENMPLDVLFLLDVSGSMRPHVERVARSAETSMRVLGRDDRVAIMVFDRQTRIRMPFRSVRGDAAAGFEDVLSREDFNGGTDITRGMLDAAQYMKRSARPEARRAIVILTDDRTEFERDEMRVGRALTGADAVMSALIAPDAMGQRGGGWPGGGGGYPGGGGRRGGISLPGGIGFPFPGGGYPGGGGRYPRGGGGGGPVILNNRTQSAGTAEIARDSGGDSLSVDDGEALETTMERIRQRYALYFLVPPGVRAGETRNVEVALAGAAARRYPNAEVRFRRTYVANSSTEGNSEAPPVELSRAPSRNEPSAPATDDPGPPRMKRRPGVIDESRSTSRGPAPDNGDPGGWKKVDPAAAPAATPAKPATEPASATGGWRKVKPGEQQ